MVTLEARWIGRSVLEQLSKGARRSRLVTVLCLHQQQFVDSMGDKGIYRISMRLRDRIEQQRRNSVSNILFSGVSRPTSAQLIHEPMSCQQAMRLRSWRWKLFSRALASQRAIHAMNALCIIDRHFS